MSQELIRRPQRSNGTSLPAAADNLWGSPQNNLPVPTQSPDAQPLQVIHRALRGRYKWALLTSAVFAAIGMVYGWTSNERTYRARGLVTITPATIDVTGQKDTTTEYGRYMASQASNIRSSEIVEAAMKTPIWKNVAGNNTMPVGAFFNSLQTIYQASSQDILVSFDHPNPKIAMAGVQATLAAYTDYRNALGQSSRNMARDWLESQKEKIEAEIKGASQTILNERKEHERGNIEKVAELKGVKLTELENRISDEQLLITEMELVRTQAKKNPRPVPEAILARRDSFFARLLIERDTAKSELARLAGSMGEMAPLVQKLRNQTTLLQGRIDEMAKAMSSDVYGVVNPINPTQSPIEVTDAEIDSRKQKIELYTQQTESLRKELNTIDNARLSITEKNQLIDTNAKLLTDIESKLSIARAREQTVNAPFVTRWEPDAGIAKDKRPTMATFGFVAGAGLPLLAFTLWGFFDKRFRYSDEATRMGGTRGIPLLGILPHLPDRLSDPSQASVAAHCVHQIRTMLQLNCLSETANVLSITSSTSGDGKTSLALALGLSFAASGSRTLLIDTDLIGGGLSSRLNIREPVGISEAITARNPLEMIRDTDVNGLSVLPVGNKGAQNASAFSPSAVRRMMTELRKHFDIIIIDTGPILGSIEATPVVAASDAVVLTVSRTQNRDLVEKAIAQLRAVGANIAGVVFNRANARDFERSVSGISLRSVSRAQSNGHSSPNGVYQDKHVGPLVHSVRGTSED